MLYTRTIRRFLLLTTFLLCINAAFAQQVTQNLNAVLKIYNQLFLLTSTPDSTALKVTISQKKIGEATPLLDYVLRTGKQNEKDMAHWFDALLTYQLGVALHKAGDENKALTTCKDARAKMQETARRGMSVEYLDSSTRHSFTLTEIDRLVTESLGVISGIYMSLGKYNETLQYSLEQLNDPQLPVYDRYQTAARAWYAKRALNQNDADFVQYSLVALRNWSRIDTANKRMLEEKNYFRGSSFAKTLADLLERNISKVDKTAIAAHAGFYLDSAGETNRAQSFYEMAVAAGPDQKQVLWPASRFAKQHDLATFADKISGLIAKGYTGEADDMIRALGETLQRVMASATDPGDHLKKIRGGKFNPKYSQGKAYRSSIELPGEISTFIHTDEFTYYGTCSWKTVAAESKEYYVAENVTAKFKALMAELKIIYADYPMDEPQGYDRYFTVHLGYSADIKLNIVSVKANSEALILSVNNQFAIK